MSEHPDLGLAPIDVVVLNPVPVTLILDFAAKESMDTNKQNTVPGQGKVLGASWLLAHIVDGAPVLFETKKVIGPPLKALVPVSTVVVAVVARDDKHGSRSGLENFRKLMVRRWLALRGPVFADE